MWSYPFDCLDAATKGEGDDEAEWFELILHALSETQLLLVEIPDGSADQTGRYLLDNPEVDSMPSPGTLFSELSSLLDECRPDLRAIAVVGRNVEPASLRRFEFLAAQVAPFLSREEGLSWLLSRVERRQHRPVAAPASHLSIEILDVGGTVGRDLMSALHGRDAALAAHRSNSLRHWQLPKRWWRRSGAIVGHPPEPVALKWVEIQRLRGVAPSLREAIPPWNGAVRRGWTRRVPIEIRLGPFSPDVLWAPSLIVLSVGEAALAGERDLSWFAEYFAYRAVVPALLLSSPRAVPRLLEMARDLAPGADERVYDRGADPLPPLELLLRRYVPSARGEAV